MSKIKQSQTDKELTMVVGCYTDKDDRRGIVTFRFVPNESSFRRLHSIDVENASYLTVDNDGGHVYAVSENGPDDSLINSVEVNAASGEMRLVNSISSGGWSPCHIIRLGTGLAVANYGSGSLALCGVNVDGSLAVCHQITVFETSNGTHNKASGRTHFTQPLIGGRVMVSNLGYDCLHVMQVTSLNPPRLKLQHTLWLPSGSGPRHMVLNSQGTMLYVVTEKSNDVMAFCYDPVSGSLSHRQTINISTGSMAAAADLHMSADGRFLYASVRRECDGIAILGIKADGILEKVGYQLTGLHPRSFAITPNGNLMMVACRDSNCIETYIRDSVSGLLSPSAVKPIEVSKPVCIKWMP